jgi:hypothetical protein
MPIGQVTSWRRAAVMPRAWPSRSSCDNRICRGAHSAHATVAQAGWREGEAAVICGIGVSNEKPLTAYPASRFQESTAMSGQQRQSLILKYRTEYERPRIPE